MSYHSEYGSLFRKSLVDLCRFILRLQYPQEVTPKKTLFHVNLCRSDRTDFEGKSECWQKKNIYIYNIGSLSLSLLLTHTDTHVRWSDHVLRPVSGVFAEVTKSRLVLKFPSRLACSHTYISPWQQLSCIAPWQHQPVHMDYNFSS